MKCSLFSIFTRHVRCKWLCRTLDEFIKRNDCSWCVLHEIFISALLQIFLSISFFFVSFTFFGIWFECAFNMQQSYGMFVVIVDGEWISTRKYIIWSRRIGTKKSMWGTNIAHFFSTYWHSNWWYWTWVGNINAYTLALSPSLSLCLYNFFRSFSPSYSFSAASFTYLLVHHYSSATQRRETVSFICIYSVQLNSSWCGANFSVPCPIDHE